MKQKEAVFMVMCTVLGMETFSEAVTLTDEQRKAVHTGVFDMFKNDEVSFSESARANYDTDSALNGYVSGVISNWIRKDKRLNGNTKYTPKHPGSRAGQGDPQIKELRKLLKIHTGQPKEEEIQGYIDRRLGELKVEKTKSVSIDVEQIPEELRDLVTNDATA